MSPPPPPPIIRYFRDIAPTPPDARRHRARFTDHAAVLRFDDAIDTQIA